MVAKRGCGTRVAGGAYATMVLSVYGHPLEEFMYDLPKPISQSDWVNLGLSNIGVKAVEIKGIVHLFDIIGGSFYPNVADFLEEARRMGISRRLPKSLPWERIGPASRLVILHNRAVIENPDEYVEAELALISTLGVRICVARASDQHCNRHKTHHDEARDYAACSRLWWQDIEGGEPRHPDANDEGTPHARQVRRVIGDVAYHGFSPPPGITPKRRLGMIGMFPIHRIEVVRDGKGGSHQEMLETVRRARLEVTLEDE